MAKKVTVDQMSCVACGLCTSIAPEVFILDDEGFAKVIVDNVDDSIADEAVNSCPVGAISAE